MFEDILDTLVDNIDQHSQFVVYLILGFSAFLENIFPPSPGDMVMVFGAFLVGIGKLDFVLVYVISTISSLAGFMFLYIIGLKVGRPFFIRKNFRFFPAQMIYDAEVKFKKWGYWIIALNRFMAGIRAVVSLIAGLSRLQFWKVFTLALISCMIWNFGLVYGGFILGQSMGGDWDQVKQNVSYFFSNYQTVFYIVLGLAVLGFIVYKLIRRHASQKKETQGGKTPNTASEHDSSDVPKD